MGGADVPCLNDTDMKTYMNNPEVRKALHIPENLGSWDICRYATCSWVVNMLRNRFSMDITTNYKKIYGDMKPFVNKIIDNHVRVLLYYGDTDMACNFMMGQQFSAGLGLKVLIRLALKQLRMF